MTKNIFLRNSLLFITLIAFLNLSLGCHYFKINTVRETNPNLYDQQLQEQFMMNKFFILHTGDKTYAMYDIRIDTLNNKLNCNISSVPAEHQYLNNSVPHIAKGKYLPAKGEGGIINEIHIYTFNLDITSVPSSIEIPFASITKIDIVDKDNGRTTASYVFGILGITVGVLAIIGLIAAATKSSCPFVYVDDGMGYIFNGEIYGGAIYPSLERDDYLPLPAVTASKDEYRIRITNELKEKQHTNLAELWYIEHEKGLTTLPDKSGKIYTISQPQQPIRASLNDRVDCMGDVVAMDSAACLFNDVSADRSMNELHVTFSKPEGVVNGKLVLRAKNSLWLDYLYGQFLQLFGSYYNTWVAQQKKVPASDHIAWSISQGIPMLVSVKTDEGWKSIDTIPSFGPLASRDLVVPVNLGQVSASNIEIKLTCGFMFWEVDYAAMDFSQEAGYHLTVIKPSSAIDEQGLNVKKSIWVSDDQYLEQPVPGCVTEVAYTLPQTETADTFSIVLHTRGYYEHVRDFKGIPDFAYLKTFREEGAFPDFSKRRYVTISSSGFSAAK